MNQTSLEEVKKIAASGDYKRIPVKREILSDIRTPLEVLRALQNVSDHVFLLESVEESRQWGRYSFLSYDPTMEITCKDHKLKYTYEGKTYEEETAHPGEFIKKVVEDNRAPRLENMPTFTGGLVGYFSYDYMQYGEPSLHFKARNDYDFSDLDLMMFDHLIVLGQEFFLWR